MASSALTEATSCANEDIYIVGGANSAGQAAVYLAKGARSVSILVRASSLTNSMSHYLIEQVENIPAIKVRACTEVVEAHGTDHLERLTLRDSNTGETQTVDAQYLFVFIGAAPLTDWLKDVVVRDDHGFVMTGPDLVVGGRAAEWAGHSIALPYHLESSVPGVFVAGDVRAESAKRVASAVGEGAMAVMLVHRYLEMLLSADAASGSPVTSAPVTGVSATEAPVTGAPVSDAAVPSAAVTGAAVTGAAVTGAAVTGADAECSADELRHLFLFEKLTDDQLAYWLHAARAG